MPKQSTQGSRIRIQVPQVRLVLDPHRMEDMYSMAIVLQVFRGLFRYDPQGEVHPDLVESWKTSDNGKTYEFKIRESYFSDGKRIRSQNVQASLARIYFLKAGIAADLQYISGSRKFQKSKKVSDLGIRAIADDRIEIKLDHPSSLLLKHLAVVDCAVLPISHFDEPFLPSVSLPASGPYKVDSLSEHAVTISKWRKDLLDSANPPKVVEFFQDERPMLELAKKGIVDTLDYDVVGASAQSELIQKGWQQTVTELVKSWFVVLNPKKVSNQLRKYLYHRVFQDQLALFLNHSNLSAAFGLIPNGMAGALSGQPIYDESKIEAIGEIRLQYPGDSALPIQIASFLKGVWESKRFSVKLEPLTRGDYLKKMFASEGEVIIGSKGMDYFDGYSELTYFRSGYEGNYFHVNDLAIDRALDEAAQVISIPERAEKYKFIQKEILGHYTVIPLVFGSLSSGLWGPKFKSIPPHSIGLHGLPLETIEVR